MKQDGIMVKDLACGIIMFELFRRMSTKLLIQQQVRLAVNCGMRRADWQTPSVIADEFVLSRSNVDFLTLCLEFIIIKVNISIGFL